MSDLQELARRIEALAAETRKTRQAEKDVDRVADWLRELLDEADRFRKLPPWHPERIRKAMRLLRQGESVPAREVGKKFENWLKNRTPADEIARTAEELATDLGSATTEDSASSFETQWQRAAASCPEKADEASLADTDLIILDLSGQAESMEATIRRSRLNFSRFRSARVVTAFPEHLPADSGLDVIQANGAFSMFDAVDDLPHESSGRTLILQTGCALLAAPVESPALQILRSVDLKSGRLSGILQRDQLRRQALLPMHPSAIVAPNSWLAGEKHLFRTFLHLTPWHLVLEAVQLGEEHLIQPEEPSVIAQEREVCLSELQREWLAKAHPELLAELRGAREEWDILRHDLILAVVRAHAELFQDQVAWLTAVGETRIRR